MVAKNKNVHLEDDIHEGLRVLAFNNHSTIRKEVDDILRKELHLDE